MGTFDARIPDGVAGTWGTDLKYNESAGAFEFARNNSGGGTVFAAGVRSATATSAALTNYEWKGATFFVNITAVPGSGSATVAIVLQAQDPVTSNWFELARSQDRSASYAVTFYPTGISESATNRVNIALPRDIRALAAVSAGATSKDVTFSVGMTWLV